LKAQQFYIVSA